MKQFILLLVITFGLVVSCRKQCIPEQARYEVGQNASFTTENFKINNPVKYSIQFPSSFQGGLMIGFEGNFFRKYDQANSIDISYNNCNGLYCYDFGITLTNTTQTSILGVFNFGHDTYLLTHRIELTRNGELVGIFYHNNAAASWGKLFWKDGGIFKDAMDAKFKGDKLREVIEIIQTIREI